MRTFKHRNTAGKNVCPICKTNDDKETVLIQILGTEDKNICEAEQFHLECLELIYDKKLNIIYQKLEGGKK